MKRSSSAGLSGQLADYYLWQEPESGIAICLKPEAVDRLQLGVLAALRSSAGAKTETGGILLGTTKLEAGRRTTTIEDFEAVPCANRHGPRYSLAEDDLVGLEAALDRRRSDPNRSLSVVGFYRSHNRDGLYLSSDDLILIRAYFREPESVFLLVKTLPKKACTAGLFFWEEGRIQSEFTYREVPFGPILSQPVDALKRFATDTLEDPQPTASTRSNLHENPAPTQNVVPARTAPWNPSETSAPIAPGVPHDRYPGPGLSHQPVAITPLIADTTQKLAPAWSARVALTSNSVAIGPAPFAESGLFEPPRHDHWTRSAPGPAMTAALLVITLLAVLGYFYRRLEQPAVSTVGLHIEQSPAYLTLTWDQDSPAMRSAQGAVLSILAGGVLKTYTLDQYQLRTSFIAYTPATDDVQFRLELYRNRKPTSGESIRWVEAVRAPAPTEPLARTKPFEHGGEADASPIPRGSREDSKHGAE
jgi:hypothetical protein